MDSDEKGKPVMNGSEVLFATNFFRVYYKGVDVNSINVYNCELSSKDERIRTLSKYKVIRQILEDHFENISHAFIFFYGLLYMIGKKEENEAGIQSLRYDAKVILRHVDTINDNFKINRFLLRYVERILASFKLVAIDGKYYDIHNLSNINEFGISVMSGYHPTIVATEKGNALLFDIAYKVIKTECIYEYIKKTYTCEADISKIKSELVGKAVITKYNCRLYTIRDVDFTQKIKTQCITINSHAFSIKEYYANKYNISLIQDDQPLLIAGNKNNSTIYLVPELCYIVGISKEMLKDFKLLKLVYSFYKEPAEYLGEIHKTIKKINESQFSKNWGIYFSANGDIVKGVKLNSGNLLLRNSRVSIDSIQSFERELQKGMIASPSLTVWGILYSARHKSAKDSLLNEIQSIVTVLQIPCKPPKLVEIPNDDLPTWMEQIKAVPSNVEALIILIPGNKNAKSSLYSNLKSYFLLNKTIPTQFLMASTIERGKNLKSICYKVITQLSTKLGGIPWEIEPLQFTDRPLMIIGISSVYIAPYHVTSICATIDKKLSRYTACTVASKVDSNIQNKILQILNTFKLTVGDYPHHIIIYKEGTMDHKKGKLLSKEINDFQQVFKLIGRESLPYTVVLVDRKTSARQFYIKKCQDGSVEVKVASPGSIISSEITQKDILEFYLTSCKSNNKEPPVTHYQCYHIDYIKEDMTRTQYFKKLQDLTYKLCFLYYNNSGSISIPAPLKYAIRLIKLIQDLSTNGVVVPKEHYEITNGLYFI